MLWGFGGPADQASNFADGNRMGLPVLVDDDRSLAVDFFIGEGGDGGFALYPRHYVIDKDGRLAYVSATQEPADLLAAIQTALGD